ncbi:hypothetical protein CELD12_29700 [Cellulomonas sp. NTE-D12]|nr:hypothetical protein CELD12_29700 [Cellulomonas sp. NTE-D12]
MVTFGLAVSKSLTVLSQYALPSPVVELCQKVMVTFAPLPPAELAVESEPEPPLLHAVSTRAPAARTAAAARDFLAFMRSVLFVELHSSGQVPPEG